ncbi:VirB3 family type IV secretion system protein [Gammaproteobacteria bacterium]|nr:VirB3 family type IV secretion system protein [Gammaproteobacteria bacterium]
MNDQVRISETRFDAIAEGLKLRKALTRRATIFGIPKQIFYIFAAVCFSLLAASWVLAICCYFLGTSVLYRAYQKDPNALVTWSEAMASQRSFVPGTPTKRLILLSK